MDQQFDLKQLYEESRKAEKLDKERAEQFEIMTKSRGWQLYMELLNTRIGNYGVLILEPAGSIDGAIALENVKGTMRGLILARDLPQLIVDAMKTASGSATDGEDK